MKRIILITLALIAFTSAFAQDYYQKDGELATDEGITFKAELSGRLIFLNNIENKLVYAREVYLDGTPYDDEFGMEQLASSHPGTITKAFTETFTKEEYLRMRNSKLCEITLAYVVGNDGNLMEVFFSVMGVPIMRAFPPSKYALLEKNLKKYVKWDITPNGKKLQYIIMMSFANFSVMDLYYPGDPIPPGNEPGLEANPLPGDGKPGFEKPPVLQDVP